PAHARSLIWHAGRHPRFGEPYADPRQTVDPNVMLDSLSDNHNNPARHWSTKATGEEDDECVPTGSARQGVNDGGRYARRDRHGPHGRPHGGAIDGRGLFARRL